MYGFMRLEVLPGFPRASFELRHLGRQDREDVSFFLL
jgi:hypothetical protein